MSLDGYAGPNGEFDWIVTDPEIDFTAFTARYDTFLIGRETFRCAAADGRRRPPHAGHQKHRVLTHAPDRGRPHATLHDDAARVVAELEKEPGKDVAVFGCRELFRSLLTAGLVDEGGVSVVPILLGGGIPLLPSPAHRARPRPKKHRGYATTGTVSLEYDIVSP